MPPCSHKDWSVDAGLTPHPQPTAAESDVGSCLVISFCSQTLDFFELWPLVFCPAANSILVNRMTSAYHDRLIPALPIAMMKISR